MCHVSMSILPSQVSPHSLQRRHYPRMDCSGEACVMPEARRGFPVEHQLVYGSVVLEGKSVKRGQITTLQKSSFGHIIPTFGYD